MLTQNVGQKEGRRGGWKTGRMSSKIRHISSLQACQLGPSVQVRGQNGNGHLSKEQCSTTNRSLYRDLAYFLPSKWHLQSQIAMTPMSLWPAGAAKPQKKTVAMHVTSTGIAISVQWCFLHWVPLCTRKNSPLQLEHPKCRHLDVFDMI